MWRTQPGSIRAVVTKTNNVTIEKSFNNCYSSHSWVQYRRSIIEPLGWSLCVHHIGADLVLRAKCIATFELICKLDSRGLLLDLRSCLDVMNSDASLANPMIETLSFDRSTRPPRQPR